MLDLASIHRAAEFRAKVPEHIHIVYIPAQSTSYCQPCDVAIFKTWKSVLADAASESLAESVVTVQNIKTAIDFTLMHLKRRSVVWAETATLDVQNRTDLRKSVWTHVCWESDEDFVRLVTQEQVMPDANQLCISHADLPADAPAAGCDTIDEPTHLRLGRKGRARGGEGAAAPTSSSVAPPTGAAIKHKRTMNKFLALRIVHGKGPKS